MKKIIFVFLVLISSNFLFAQDAADYKQFSAYNGKTVGKINVTTKRLNPNIVKEKFTLREGETFTYQKFDYARRAVHDMRIFKKVDVGVSQNANNTVDINIDGEDGYYIFPLPIVAGGGGGTTAGLFLMEANLFKQGELGFAGAMFSDDGYLGILGMHHKDSSYSLFYNKQDYDAYNYTNGSFNNSGIMGGGNDDDDKPYVNRFNTRKTAFAASYGYSLMEKLSFNIGFSYEDVDYRSISGTNALPADKGNHSTAFAGISFYNNIKPSKGMAGAMGSVFGLGTSDKEHKIVNLPYVRPGYFVSLNYNNGASYTGADYDISTLDLTLMGSLELKTRHTLNAVIRGAQNFEGGFYDSVSSRDLLAGKGRYTTQYFGEKGYGGGLYASLFIMRNSLLVMVLEPFAETSYLFDGHTRYNQTGVGSSLYATFWRFQLPMGLNFTYDTDAGESTVSFIFGAGF